MHPQKITIMKKGGYVYIMTNKSKTVLYTGVTNDLCRRVFEHQNHTNPESFASKYKCHHCVYFEEFTDITEAIAREKAIKQLSREKKNALKMASTQNGKNWLRQKVSSGSASYGPNK